MKGSSSNGQGVNVALPMEAAMTVDAGTAGMGQASNA
jgi:hypothetical protein